MRAVFGFLGFLDLRESGRHIQTHLGRRTDVAKGSRRIVEIDLYLRDLW
jgi:hypothetical protein